MKQLFISLFLLASLCCLAAPSTLSGFRGIKGGTCTLAGDILKGRAATPNAGISSVVPAVPGWRTAYRCEVRGSGKLRAMVSGQLGQVTSIPVFELTGEWQPVEVSYANTTSKVSFSLFVPAGAPNASFEVRNFSCKLERLESVGVLEALAVSPICLRAAEMPGRHGVLRKDGDTQVVWGKRWYIAARLPVPVTAAPIYYYARMRHQGKGVGIANLIHHDSLQIVAPEVRFASGDAWQWLRFGPIPTGHAFPEAAIRFGGDAQSQYFLDRVVIATDASLTPAQLDAMPCQVSDRASVAVGRGTPAIDGKLDDAAWVNSLPIGPFMLMGRTVFAAEQTMARMLWDDENLYLAFSCGEPALAPSANRMHAFQRKVTAHDQEAIYKDDCIAILLANPAVPSQVCEVVVNAAGAILDSRDERSNMWQKRDKGWESGARAAVQVHAVEPVGHWDAEVAIPWKALGGKTGAIPWEIKLGRFEWPSKEMSSYTPLSGGLHLNESFFEARFVPKVPGAGVSAWPEFAPGANRLAIQSDQPLLLRVETAFDRKPPLTVHSDRDAVFSLDGKDAFRFRWSIADAALREMLRSPQYRLALSAQTMEVSLPKGARLLCNGRAATTRTLLASGRNELEVQAPAEAPVHLAVNGAPIPFPEGWRKAGADRWKLTLADGATELWPNWKADALHLIRGGVQHLFFCPRGFPGSTAHEYTLVLDLPEGVRFLGASGYLNHYQTTVRESPSPLGQSWTRRRIVFAQPRKWSETLSTDRYYTVVLAADANSTAKEGAFYFHAESPADGLSEAPQKVPLVFLPPVRGTQPKRLGVGISSFRLGALDDLALTRRTLAFFRDLGATRYTSASKNHYEELPCAIYFNFRWCFSFVPFLKEHPDYALIDRRGRRSANLICSRRFLTAPECRKYIVDSLPAWQRRWGMVEHICWDYEYRVLDAPLACFCDDCRADFAKAAGLPKVPEAAEIAARHFEAWTDYMTTRFADLAELLCKAAHEALPGIVFSVYSGYQSDENCSFFGVDWRKVDGRIDLAIAGYGRDPAVLAATRKALPHTPLALGAYTRPYEFGDKRPVPPITLAQLLRRSADATAGFFVYYLPNLDGRSYTAISRAASILAQYEPFFLRGENHPERLAVAGLPEADAALLSDGQGKWLLVLMNHGRRPQRFRLDAAKLGLSGLPPEVTLAPGDAAALPAK